jgi:hypothetical protein
MSEPILHKRPLQKEEELTMGEGEGEASKVEIREQTIQDTMVAHLKMDDQKESVVVVAAEFEDVDEEEATKTALAHPSRDRSQQTISSLRPINHHHNREV